MQLFLPYSNSVESQWKLTSFCICMLGIKNKIFLNVLCVSHCNPFISNSLFAIWSLFCVLPPSPVIYLKRNVGAFVRKSENLASWLDLYLTLVLSLERKNILRSFLCIPSLFCSLLIKYARMALGWFISTWPRMNFFGIHYHENKAPPAFWEALLLIFIQWCDYMDAIYNECLGKKCFFISKVIVYGEKITRGWMNVWTDGWMKEVELKIFISTQQHALNYKITKNTLIYQTIIVIYCYLQPEH